MKEYRLSNQEYRILIDVLNSRARELYDGDVRITSESVWETKEVTFQVNWCCMGSVDSTKAIEFAKALTVEARLADNMNNLNVICDWELEDTIKGRDGYKEKFNQLKALIEKMA